MKMKFPKYFNSIAVLFCALLSKSLSAPKRTIQRTDPAIQTAAGCSTSYLVEAEPSKKRKLSSNTHHQYPNSPLEVSSPSPIETFNSTDSTFFRFNGNELTRGNVFHVLTFIKTFVAENPIELEFNNIIIDETFDYLAKEFYKNNSKKICSVRINNCASQGRFGTFNYETFSNLTKVELINFDSKYGNLLYLLKRLPQSITTLVLSFKNRTVSLRGPHFAEIFLKLSNLVELRFENLDVKEPYSILPLFALPQLRKVHLFGNFGLVVARKLQELRPTWKEFSFQIGRLPRKISEKEIHDFEFPELGSITELTTVDISATNWELVEVLNSLSESIDQFSNLKLIIARNYQNQLIKIPDSVVKSQIKIQADYELLRYCYDDWKNYFSVFTGISIDFNQSVGFSDKVFSELNEFPSFLHHVVCLSFKCESIENLDQLKKLLNYLPNLKNITVSFTNDFDTIMRNARIDNTHQRVETLSVHFGNEKNIFNGTSKFLSWFSNLKKLSINSDLVIDFKQLNSIVEIAWIEAFEFNTSLDFMYVEQFLKCIQSIPKLRSLGLKFTDSSVKEVENVNLFSMAQLHFAKLTHFKIVTECTLSNNNVLSEFLLRFSSLVCLELSIIDDNDYIFFIKMLTIMKRVQYLHLNHKSESRQRHLDSLLKHLNNRIQVVNKMPIF